MCGRRLQILILIAATASGCAWSPDRAATQQPPPIQLAAHQQDARKTVYVVGHGWHTGLVLRTRDISPQQLPGLQYLADTDLVEFGWGDEGFYRAQTITVPLVLRAAFWPTPSVLHVAGIRGPVQQFYKFSDIVEIKLTDRQFHDMCRFISDTFARSESGQTISLGPGIYGESTFFRAKGKYYFPNTCNVWIAKALQQAGFRVTPQLVITADGVLAQTRKFGRDLQRSSAGLKQAALRGTSR
ncbi:MAG: DUF2459 domain-containing protein [Planctomycetes bacterium]|nr:DUF2459 domain-containing protein [Planctomycetota bacterium]